MKFLHFLLLHYKSTTHRRQFKMNDIFCIKNTEYFYVKTLVGSPVPCPIPNGKFFPRHFSTDPAQQYRSPPPQFNTRYFLSAAVFFRKTHHEIVFWQAVHIGPTNILGSKSTFVYLDDLACSFFLLWRQKILKQQILLAF